MDLSKHRKKIIVAAAIVAVFIAVVVSLFTRQNEPSVAPPEEIDSIPEAFFDYEIHTNIIGGKELARAIESRGDMEVVSRDMNVFGRKAYDAYKNNPKKPVGFKITSDITVADNTISFGGRYGSSENKVSVSIKLLNNRRMELSITDTATDFNIDSELSANSKVNRFVGGLPVAGDGYNITFVKGNTINIGLYFRDPELFKRARQYIVEAIGEDGIQQLEITRSFPSQGL